MTTLTAIPKIQNPEQGGIVGGAWLNAKLRALALSWLDPVDFVGPDRTLFAALVGSNGNFNYLTAEPHLDEPARLRLRELQGVIARVPIEAEYMQWMKGVREHSALRQMHAELGALTADMKPGADIDKLAARVVEAVSRFRSYASREVEADLDKVVDMERDATENWQKGAKDKSAVMTGFGRIDRMTGGMKRGHVTVLGARPAMGKTQLALQFARNAALKIKAEERDAVVVIFSAEMTGIELAERLAQCASGISAEWLQEGEKPDGKKTIKTPAEDYDKFRAALDELKKIGKLVKIDETASPTTARMRQRVAAHAAQHKDGADLVIFDFIQLAGDTGKKNDNETTRVDHIMNGLKAIAKDNNCAVLALAQLGREVEKRADRFPDLADLRQSGNIEALANQVLFIDRPEAYKVAGKWPNQKLRERGENYEQRGGNAAIVIAKNRNRRSRKLCVMEWTPEITRFAELEDKDEDKPTDSLAKARKRLAAKEEAGEILLPKEKDR